DWDSEPVFMWGQGADVVFTVGTVGVVGIIEIQCVGVIVFDFQVKITGGSVGLLPGGRVSKWNEDVPVHSLRRLVSLESDHLTIKVQFEAAHLCIELSGSCTGRHNYRVQPGIPLQIDFKPKGGSGIEIFQGGERISSDLVDGRFFTCPE